MLLWRGLSSLKTSFWSSITVLKLLRALSNSSKRSSTIKIWYLNLCLLLQRASLCYSPFFSIELFRIRIKLFCCFLSIYACASSSIDRAGWLHETSWLTFHKRVKTSKTSQLTFSSLHVIEKQFQQSSLPIAVLVLKWCRIVYQAINEPAHLMHSPLKSGNERCDLFSKTFLHSNNVS